MKVLFCGFKYEYGKPEAGLSFEYQNFYEVLRRMEGVELEGFFIDEQMLALGRNEMNSRLVQVVVQSKPDLLFCFLFTEEIKKETIHHITNKTSTETFNWFADDHWRFPIYSKYWAPLFSFVSTTDSEAIPKYKARGLNNVIKTQWAANHFLYKPEEYQLNNNDNHDYNITFVGKNYGTRGAYIELLKKHGLPASGFGKGWSSGIVDQQEMLKIFSSSKINLNFTESPYVTAKDRLKLFTKLFLKRELGKVSFNAHHIVDNFMSALGTQRRQIKGRTFEVPACGGFLLTGEADNLGDYYEDGKEIVIFKNKADLLEKCKYYLSHESERLQIAKAGFERTLLEHTYERRFREIFKQMELV